MTIVRAENSPSVSVVMPLYNNASEVRRGIGSVVSQSVASLELIVVNDGSTDGGEKVVEEFRDSRIRLLHQPNKGVSAARNCGVAEAKSELIAFLDADDEWKPDFLETIFRLYKAFPQCGVFATHYSYRERNGNFRSPILRRVPDGSWEGVIDNYFEVAANSDPPIWSSAVAVKKKALISVEGFPEGITIGEDLLTWARLAVAQKIAYSKKQCSVFWLRGSLTGYPTRRPEVPDNVGEQLSVLLTRVPPEHKKGFLQYCALWHRMRVSMFIQLQDRPNAMIEIRKMIRLAPANPQVYIYGALALTPRMVRKFVVQIFTLLKMFRRNFMKD
jgi:glycosyltransferase involved in cell wall biosynthesis